MDETASDSKEANMASRNGDASESVVTSTRQINGQIFVGGAETPLLYRSRDKLKKIETGRLYSPQEAEALGMWGALLS